MALSIIMITKNAAGVVLEALTSIKGLWSELLVDDDESTDRTQEVVKQYGGTVITSHEKNLGQRKQALVDRAKGEWVLVLDSDERVSPELYKEIQQVFKNRTATIHGYWIPYQNYVFGKPVYHGGERYRKARLFQKPYGRVAERPLHEEVVVDGKVGELSGVIHHHSYRTPLQLFGKFTGYAVLAARQKQKQGESLTMAKLFFYGPHMFWARYVKDQGYKDGWRGLVLALAFGYMEGLTYWFLIV